MMMQRVLVSAALGYIIHASGANTRAKVMGAAIMRGVVYFSVRVLGWALCWVEGVVLVVAIELARELVARSRVVED